MTNTNDNPLKKLAQSRRFWMLILDTIVSIVLHFFAGENARFLVAALQPVFIVIIAAFTIEDREQIRADAQVQSAKVMQSSFTYSVK